jgi:uncharacterized RDD family membrane protein YckC
MMWYYALNGERFGPVDPVQLANLVAQGTVQNDTLVWRQGMADWKRYAEIAPTENLPLGGGAPPPDTEVCAMSGKRYPRSEMIQFEGRWVSAEHREAFFQRVREGAPLPNDSVVPGPYGYGGFWRRFVAVVIDGLIIGMVGVLISVVAAAVFAMTGGFDPENPTIPVMFQVVLQLVQIALALVYEVYFIRRYDATPGKMALGVKVLRADGSKLSAARIVGRYFAKIVSSLILLIGYIIAAFDDQKRALHDYMCDTRVIKSRA